MSASIPDRFRPCDCGAGAILGALWGSTVVPSHLQALTALALEVQKRRSLEDLLQVVVDQTAELLGGHHASIRLLNPSRTHLIAVCRTGEPVHLEPAEFGVGEGLIGWIANETKPIRTDDAPGDERFVQREGMRPVKAFVGVPLISGNSCVGVLSVLKDEGGFDDNDEQLLILAAAICAPYLEIARLSRLSEVDPLTGALNRRGLDSAFPEEAPEPPEQTESSFSVIMVDVDHFKRINDTHGHAVGDEVLRHIARLLSQVLRKTDAIVRWGGEEFLLMLPEVGLGRALKIAERARSVVEENPTPVGGGGIECTVSMGVAERHDGESRHQLVDRADTALYEAKQRGRNRVVAG